MDFRLVEDKLSQRLDNDFSINKYPPVVLFAGQKNSSRLTESYNIAKRLSGGSNGAVRYYLDRNIAKQLSFVNSVFENSPNDFNFGNLIRLFDICFNSPNALSTKDVSDIYYNYLSVKKAFNDGNMDYQRHSKAIQSIYRYLSSNVQPKNITIDDVRQIIVFLSQSLADGMSRCVIIEGIEDANVSVNNALLKTLEEPYDKSLVILISKNRSRIMKTILSRVVTYNFVPIITDKFEQFLSNSRMSFKNDYTDIEDMTNSFTQIQDIRKMTYDFFNCIIKGSDNSKLVADKIISKLLDKKNSDKDVVEAFLRELSLRVEESFGIEKKYSIFYEDLMKKINNSFYSYQKLNISAVNALEMLLM